MVKMIKKSQLHFISQLPKNFNFKQSILIFDAILMKKNSAWIKKFPRRLGVRSGEKLKDVKNFPPFIEQILEQCEGVAKSELTIVAFGGGSVGDFAGFSASILKRGVRLVQIPSTWLAAMDSAHGGKTALNVGNFKNQIGTFYSAQEIFLVKEILCNQPPERIQEAAGEYYKMAFVEGGSLWKKALSNPQITSEILWQHLPLVIRAKWKIVKLDPYETKSLRYILNLGHTVGHVLESELHLAHGRAVHAGLKFSLNWGRHLGLWDYQKEVPEWMLPNAKDYSKILRSASKKKLIHALAKDKKLSKHNEVQFLFVKKPGQVIVKKMKLSELVREWQRQI